MQRKTFSKKEVEQLKANPYTYKVTERSISFTVTTFWERYQVGYLPSKIIRDLGYDPAVFGSRRIEGIASHIKREAAVGFHEGTQRRGVRARNIDVGAIPPSQALIRMQHEITYMRQELELIKKIIKMDDGSGLKK